MFPDVAIGIPPAVHFGLVRLSIGSEAVDGLEEAPSRMVLVPGPSIPGNPRQQPFLLLPVSSAAPFRRPFAGSNGSDIRIHIGQAADNDLLLDNIIPLTS